MAAAVATPAPGGGSLPISWGVLALITPGNSIGQYGLALMELFPSLYHGVTGQPPGDIRL
jgi:hypothetical protein